MTLEQKTDIKTVPLQGGAITVREKPLLPFGAFSMVQNMRGHHPGFESRKGSAQHHTTTLGSSAKTLSLYQFSKGKRTERHFLAQMSDDDVYDAANAPPGTGTDFSTSGATIFTGTATSKPASWGNMDDILLFSNGTDQHQLYAGTENYVKRFVKYDHATDAPPEIPADGFDYTQQVTDGKDTTYGDIHALDLLTGFECLFICCPVPANRLKWTIPVGYVNTAESVTTLEYWKSDNNWVDLVTGHDFDDDTIVATGKTLSGTESMTWTHPTDEVPKMMYGYSGFWYRLSVSVQLTSASSLIKITSLTYGSSFSPLQNVWDGWAPYAIEAQFFDESLSIYKRFSSDMVEIDSMVHSAGGTVDKIYFSTPDPIIGCYIDVGDTPNQTETTAIYSIKVWTGASWQSVGTPVDGTSGFANSGWITWGRPPYNSDYYPEKTQFQKSQYYAYWYYIDIKTATMSDNVIISITTMPYFDIEALGAIGYVSCAWKDRAVYNFGDNLGYASAKLKPMTLNGADFGVLEAGDGRANRWICAKKFHTELLVWQQELGDEGGCLTLFEGYSPQTYGKMLLSSKVGTLNAKSAVVVDGVMTSTRTDEALKTLAFFISHYGVFVTDGRTVSAISDDIQNFFDPNDTTYCLTQGNTDDAWIVHDTSRNVLRLGIRCGSGGTWYYPVFDLTDWTWSFDVLGQTLSAMCEVEAASGDISVLQYGGGSDDGFIYRLNTGDNDYNGSTKTKITSYIQPEFNGQGLKLVLAELLLLMKTQTGDAELTVYKNGVTVTAVTDIDLSMVAENTSEIFRRHRKKLNVIDEHISVKIQHDAVDESCYLEALGVNMKEVENQ